MSRNTHAQSPTSGWHWRRSQLNAIQLLFIGFYQMEIGFPQVFPFFLSTSSSADFVGYFMFCFYFDEWNRLENSVAIARGKKKRKKIMVKMRLPNFISYFFFLLLQMNPLTHTNIHKRQQIVKPPYDFEMKRMRSVFLDQLFGRLSHKSFSIEHSIETRAKQKHREGADDMQ